MADEAKNEKAEEAEVASADGLKTYVLKAGKKHDAIENGEVVRKEPGDEVQLTDGQAAAFADKFFLKGGPEHAEAVAAIETAREKAIEAAQAQAAADEASSKAQDETAGASTGTEKAGDPPAGGGAGKTGDESKPATEQAPAKK